MTDAKFTPGPWAVRDKYGPAGWRISVNGMEVATALYLGGTDPALANARLIAAAPDLYTLAERAMRWFADNQCAGDLAWEIGEALAKARGEAADLTRSSDVSRHD